MGLVFGITTLLMFGVLSLVAALLHLLKITIPQPIDAQMSELFSLPLFGLGFAIIGSLIGGFVANDIKLRSQPNEGIHRSIKMALLSGFSIGLASALILAVINSLSLNSGSLTESLPASIFLGTFIGFMTGVSYGGLACIQHYVLRGLLVRYDNAPWNYARFLDYCADRIFLRKVGGGYIFIHRLLMEYFAELDTTAIEETQKEAT